MTQDRVLQEIDYISTGAHRAKAYRTERGPQELLRRELNVIMDRVRRVLNLIS